MRYGWIAWLAVVIGCAAASVLSGCSSDPQRPIQARPRGSSSTSAATGSTFISDADGGPPDPIECTTWEQACTPGSTRVDPTPLGYEGLGVRAQEPA